MKSDLAKVALIWVFCFPLIMSVALAIYAGALSLYNFVAQYV